MNGSPYGKTLETLTPLARTVDSWLNDPGPDSGAYVLAALLVRTHCASHTAGHEVYYYISANLFLKELFNKRFI